MALSNKDLESFGQRHIEGMEDPLTSGCATFSSSIGIVSRISLQRLIIFCKDPLSDGILDLNPHSMKVWKGNLDSCLRRRIRHHQSCLDSRTWLRLGKKLAQSSKRLKLHSGKLWEGCQPTLGYGDHLPTTLCGGDPKGWSACQKICSADHFLPLDSGFSVTKARERHSKLAQLESTHTDKTEGGRSTSSGGRLTTCPGRPTSFNLTPVLQGSSNGSYLICGFYCPTQQTQACLFGVVLFSTIDYLIALELVWSANQDRPVQIDTTLQLTGDGDLILHDADGTFVWSTNTSGKSVFSMNLTELGNLVLFDQNNATVWQSFDHPTDSLLVGQTLFRGQKLTFGKSASNLTPGLFSFKVQDYYKMVVAYVESNPPLPYFKSYVGVKYVKFKKESFLGHKIPVASSSSPHHQFIRLDLDGHLKAYEWDGWNWNWNVTTDLMTSDIGECGYPMVCGNYDICSSNGQCSCLEEAIYNSTFWQINSRQPSLGCSLVTPISCDHSKYHTLLELKNTKKLALEDCKTSCLKNFSCKVAFFAYTLGYDSKQGCLLLSEVFSLLSNEGTTDETVVLFLKVQKSPTAQNLIPSAINSPQKKSGNKSLRILMSSLLIKYQGCLPYFLMKN
ncbi:hypothetical protein HYC85_026793 [Camellia sinensis]|uniref:Bulb-type lectin domain-containing protein n=1 Tax=Camellia sinensis TaxID=4442 RepID=A0A7J7G8J2_CAMSI|nr:hypothetical protein HYC85_026793 [Camellia sinensis]